MKENFDFLDQTIALLDSKVPECVKMHGRERARSVTLSLRSRSAELYRVKCRATGVHSLDTFTLGKSAPAPLRRLLQVGIEGASHVLNDLI